MRTRLFPIPTRLKPHHLATLFLGCMLAVMLCILIPTANAAAIIGGDFGPGLTLGPTDSAGVAPYAQTNWNSVLEAATNFVLKDNSGVTTTARLTTTGANSFASINGSNDNFDEALNNSRANGSSAWSFTLNQIPYASYSIVVYDLDFVAGAVKGISLGGTTFYSSSPSATAAGYLDGNAATPYTYNRATSTNPAAPTPLSNYVMFQNLTGATQTVSISGSGGNFRVGGFQIAEGIPEPASGVLLAGAATALLGFRCRFRKSE